MKVKPEKPACPKCGKPMRHLSTGSFVKTYFCNDCNETKIINRDDIKEPKK